MARPLPALLLLLAGVVLGVVIGLGLDRRAGSYRGQGVLLPDGSLAASRVIQGESQAVTSSGSATRVMAPPSLPRAASSEPDSLSLARAGELASLALADAQAAQNVPVGAAADGVIVGSVVDHLGRPIEGAVITTSNHPELDKVRTSIGSGLGRGWSEPSDVYESIKDRAASTLSRRRRELRTQTDSAGRFQMTGLVPGRHSLYARAEGQIFRGKSALVGGAVHFQGSAVQLFHLAVEHEDGSPAERAIIETGRPNRPKRYEWTPDEPVLRLEASTEHMRALSGGLLKPASGSIFADYASERRRVNLITDGPGPHRFVLEETASLVVTVGDRAKTVPRPEPSVSYALATAVQEAGGRSSFLRVAKSIRRDDDGAFRVMDLAPGAYVVGVGRNGGAPVVFRDFVMEGGNVREFIELPALVRSRYIVATVRGPGGEALPGAKFQSWSWLNDKLTTSRLSGTEVEPGEYWIPRTSKAMQTGGSLRLLTTVLGWGSVIQPMPPTGSDASVLFQPPCNLTVRVAGSTELTYSVRAHEVAPLPDGDVRSMERSREEFTDLDGEVHFPGIQPGQAEITALAGMPRTADGGSGKTVVQETVSLRSGDQTITVTPEALYELAVSAPGLLPDTDLHLKALVDGQVQTRRLWGGPTAKLDANRQARFKGLKAGRYELRSNWSAPPVVVAVPSGVVNYEVPECFGYKVVPQNPEASIEPFQSDDIVLEVDGASVATGRFTSRLQLALAEAPAEVTVLRNGKEHSLELTRWVRDVQFMPVSDPGGQ